MFAKPTIVALNGSPHAGVGNTAMMIEMLRPGLAQEGFQLEVIHLAGLEIEYCTGCVFCLEKGRCWIDDDHHRVTEKVLAADGLILASPVHFLNVTGQMKTFFDRSLAFGHKPRQTWKPGLAIAVSAGLGETEVAKYLALLLSAFGAFSVGTLTAITSHLGGFWGKDAVEARAADLAKDLGRAIKERRRNPATEWDLRYYQFMGSLVEGHKDTVMKHDYQHWMEHGLYEGFEAYIQQKPAEAHHDPAMREAWIKDMIERQKAKKKGQQAEGEEKRASPSPQTAGTCAELLRLMPLSFNAAAAGDLKAVYQFEVSGEENFVAHLRIADGICSYHEGRANTPNMVIKTPADVWLKVARGELSGQKAFMEQLYKVEGDMTLLLKLKSLFSR